MSNTQNTASTTSLTDRIAIAQEHAKSIAIDRNEAITAIRSALKRRSGKTWSVTGGSGTAWGWIKISAPPKRWETYGMSDADTAELGELLGLGTIDAQGVSIAASSDHRAEYVARAEGRTASIHGVQYWD